MTQNSGKLNILVLDDEKRLRDELGEFLIKRDHKIYPAATPDEAFLIFEQQKIDIAIVDIRLPGMSGLELLKRIKLTRPDLEVIMISGHGDMQSVIEALRYGAVDYFQKPFRMPDVQYAIERTSKYISLIKRLQQSEHTVHVLTNKLYDDIGSPMIGKSPAILKVMALMQKVAASDQTNVLITGESGTGKELVAHGIHLLSDRRNYPFHSVNCSAITDSLFESEFFGHKKGSFTGAIEDRPGYFELATKGTLFLDEIGDLPLGQQAKLLRTLEDHKVRPVGSTQILDVDVRVIAASNQNLEQMIGQKSFRSDLYHRLGTFIINLPPLRERREDIEPLTRHFITHFATKMNREIRSITREAIRFLEKYPFPGNIRELRNIIERAIILCDGTALEIIHFDFIQKGKTNITSTPQKKSKVIEVNTKQLILDALEKSGHNKSKAAELLNISWQTLHRKMKKFGLDGMSSLQ